MNVVEIIQNGLERILNAFDGAWVDFISKLELFFFIVLACFTAKSIWWLCMERSESNISLFLRFKDSRYNCLAILYKEIRDLRLKGLIDDDIQKCLQDKYNKKAFPFMLSTSIPMNQEEIRFVWMVINNKYLLFEYVADPNFNKKKFKALLNEMNISEMEKEAKISLMRILKDKSATSVNNAMIWLPAIMSEPFVGDPDDEGRVIKKLENHFSVLYYLTDIYFDSNTSQDDFIDCLNKLKEINPNMRFAASKSHSSKCIQKMHLNDSRKHSIITKIESLKLNKDREL